MAPILAKPHVHRANSTSAIQSASFAIPTASLAVQSNLSAPAAASNQANRPTSTATINVTPLVRLVTTAPIQLPMCVLDAMVPVMAVPFPPPTASNVHQVVSKKSGRVNALQIAGLVSMATRAMLIVRCVLWVVVLAPSVLMLSLAPHAPQYQELNTIFTMEAAILHVRSPQEPAMASTLSLT